MPQDHIPLLPVQGKPELRIFKSLSGVGEAVHFMKLPAAPPLPGRDLPVIEKKIMQQGPPGGAPDIQSQTTGQSPCKIGDFQRVIENTVPMMADQGKTADFRISQKIGDFPGVFRRQEFQESSPRRRTRFRGARGFGILRRCRSNLSRRELPSSP